MYSVAKKKLPKNKLFHNNHRFSTHLNFLLFPNIGSITNIFQQLKSKLN